MNDFETELQHLINRHSIENESNTPDFILAQHMIACLAAFTTAVQQRETWYGRDARPSLPREESTDAVREYKAFAASEKARGVRITTKLADAAIAELEAELNESLGACSACDDHQALGRLCDKYDAMKARAEKAEAALADLQRLTESLDGDRTLDRVLELEAEARKLRGMLDDACEELAAYATAAGGHGEEVTADTMMESLAARYEAEKPKREDT